MKSHIRALLSVASELAQQAKNSMPHLRNGEVIIREWLKGGEYYRETVYDNKKLLTKYDFARRTVSFC